MYWTKDIDDGAARQEEKRKTTGCSKEGYEKSWCHRRGGQGEMKADDLLWQPSELLKETK